MENVTFSHITYEGGKEANGLIDLRGLNITFRNVTFTGIGKYNIFDDDMWGDMRSTIF